MKVGFASMDWSKILDPVTRLPTLGGSGWYRAQLPHDALAAAGVGVALGRLIFNRRWKRLGIREWIEGEVNGYIGETDAVDGSRDHWDCDVVVLQRWMVDRLWDDIVAARQAGQAVINDVDDWFFGLASQNLASRVLNNDPRSNLSHYRKVLISSDLVLTSTPYLARRLSKFCPNVRVVRNHIDIERWDEASKVEQREVPVLGWAGAMPWRSGDLETLRGRMEPVLSRKTPFHHSGDVDWAEYPPAGRILRLPDDQCTSSVLCPIYEWPDQFRHFDVGIVPLSDRPFNEAKSAIKGMEYAAAGKPFIAQDMPEYRWLKEWGAGRVVEKARGWQRHLAEVLDMSAADRRAEGEANREALIDGGLTTRYLAERWMEAVLGGMKTRRTVRAV